MNRRAQSHGFIHAVCLGYLVTQQSMPQSMLARLLITHSCLSEKFNWKHMAFCLPHCFRSVKEPHTGDVLRAFHRRARYKGVVASWTHRPLNNVLLPCNVNSTESPKQILLPNHKISSLYTFSHIKFASSSISSSCHKIRTEHVMQISFSNSLTNYLCSHPWFLMLFNLKFLFCV